jgi:hypothetical protein
MVALRHDQVVAGMEVSERLDRSSAAYSVPVCEFKTLFYYGKPGESMARIQLSLHIMYTFL